MKESRSSSGKTAVAAVELPPGHQTLTPTHRLLVLLKASVLKERCYWQWHNYRMLLVLDDGARVTAPRRFFSQCSAEHKTAVLHLLPHNCDQQCGHCVCLGKCKTKRKRCSIKRSKQQTVQRGLVRHCSHQTSLLLLH